MARKQDAYYFDNFIACAEESCHAASLLRKVLGDFRPQELEKYLGEIHEIENRADGKKHEMLDRLAKEFIPPIEREDIVELSQHIDTVTDKVEDVLLRIYMGNAQEIEPDALEMTDVVIQCCEKVRELLTAFADFRRSKKSERSDHPDQRAGGNFRQAVYAEYEKASYRVYRSSSHHCLERDLHLPGEMRRCL